MTDVAKVWVGKITKYSVGLATAAIATYAAVRPEEQARLAVVRVEVSHRELSSKVVEVQKWARFNEALAKEAKIKCRSDVAALTSFVTGFMMGMNNTGSNKRNSSASVDSEEVKSLIRALGEHKTQPLIPKTTLPKLAPPSSVKHLFEQKSK